MSSQFVTFFKIALGREPQRASEVSVRGMGVAEILWAWGKVLKKLLI